MISSQSFHNLQDLQQLFSKARQLGMRISAHVYNDTDDIQQFIDVVKKSY